MISQLKPRNLFLLDGIGAIVSATFLGVILVRLEQYIGMPNDTLYLLAILALGLSLYSLSCYLFFPSKWKPFLKFIAAANSMYCLFTLCLIGYHFQSLSLLGLSYFLLEICVIILLVRIEWKTISRSKH